MDLIEKIYRINAGLRRRFPNGNGPFEIMTRVLEEAGELAEQVAIFEDTGIKREKHGEPDRAALAKEIQDVLRTVLQIAQYYGVEADVEASVEKSYQKLKSEGYFSDQE